jgi:hypothetical protein
MPSLLTVGDYKSLMQDHGFAPVTVYDATRHVLPSLTRLGRFCTLFVPWLVKVSMVNRHTLANRMATETAVGAFQRLVSLFHPAGQQTLGKRVQRRSGH